MFLDAIAQKAMHEEFLGWDPSTALFGPASFEGRLAPVDRFLEFKNGPTRMRQLLVKPGTPLPDSKVFKHSATGLIYTMGTARSDTRWNIDDGQPYDTLVIAREMTPNGIGTAGLAEHHRRAPTGPAAEPGWYVDDVVASIYVDMEYQTSAAEEGVYDARVSRFYGWTSTGSDIRELDTLILDGRSYRVTDVYADMGFMGMKLSQDPDPRVDLYVISAGRAYNNATHEFEGAEVKHEVTAIVSGERLQAPWDKLPNAIEVVIDTGAIGFKPTPDMKVEINGVRRNIKNAYTAVGGKQYSLVCV